MCIVQVVTHNSFMVNAQLEGKVISSNENMLVADFSKQAKELHLQGEYNKTLVETNKCVELK